MKSKKNSLIELALVNRLRLTGKSKPDEAQPVNKNRKRDKNLNHLAGDQHFEINHVFVAPVNLLATSKSSDRLSKSWWTIYNHFKADVFRPG